MRPARLRNLNKVCLPLFLLHLVLLVSVVVVVQVLLVLVATVVALERMEARMPCLEEWT